MKTAQEWSRELVELHRTEECVEAAQLIQNDALASSREEIHQLRNELHAARLKLARLEIAAVLPEGTVEKKTLVEKGELFDDGAGVWWIREHLSDVEEGRWRLDDLIPYKLVEDYESCRGSSKGRFDITVRFTPTTDK